MRAQPSDSSQARIDHLEQLVHTLLKNTRSLQNQINSPSSIDDDDTDHTTILAKAGTVINISSEFKERLSVNEAHWALLLNEIGEVRSHLRAQQKNYEEQTKRISHLLRRSDDPGPTLLFGSTRNMSRSELLSQLPSRYSCDIMVKRFWAHLYPPMHFLHRATFHKQYECFWNDETTASTAWVALLFAILRIAMLDYIRDGDEPPEYRGKCQDLAATFRNRFTDCLILADYTRPQEFLIEALCFHCYGEYVSSRDAKSSTWVLQGMILRLAMRMGYHQTSQPQLSSTPFQAELRRRTWAHIRSADIMFSFQLGLPSMVRIQSFDDPFPRNIHDDEDFSEDCTAIPPALPDSELTQISYLISKSKLVFAFQRALEEISRPDSMRWERVLEIDRELRHIYENVPDYWKLGQLSTPDSLVVIAARFNLSSIHHKALCVLHSRFLDSKSADDRFAYSRRVCLSSAMSILRFQAIQNQKIPVDDHLRSLTNYQTSLTIHDYLLAATIISADLFSGRSTQHSAQGVPPRSEMIKALELSSRIFYQMRDQSMEAFKAADILKMLVRKFQAEDQTSPKEIRYTPNADTSYSAIRREFGVPAPRSGNEFEADRHPESLSRTLTDQPTSLEARSDFDIGEFGARNTALPQLLPNLDWMEPDISSVSSSTGVVDFGADICQSMFDENSGTSYSSFALNDPMSTLCNFSL
ncbi:hypothetical protein H2200_012775 [Cladophialophora chaetospira]|uniref:Xylanolytic transcriptional activator regulatory domain-containing protein n=1 Tax=Cladophialophora chaetospira TaxID=386627 RepID=A0AA38WWW7_9EURO|nr:hypothetical protein H2200_012775 [Cladophialophora chaetospira]